MTDPIDAPSTHDHVDVELEWAVGAMRLPVADRWRRGVTIVTTPRASSIGALVRARDLHKATLLEAIRGETDGDS